VYIAAVHHMTEQLIEVVRSARPPLAETQVLSGFIAIRKLVRLLE